MSEVRQLGDDDLQEFVALRSIAYPGSGVDAAKKEKLLAERLPYTRGLFHDAGLACVATMWPFEMNAGGVDVAMGGLAGVASAPEYRRGGLVRELLLHELERLRYAGTAWCLEYPFDPHFYHRLGWQSVPSGVRLELPSERLFRGVRPRTARRLPIGELTSLAAIFDTWRRRYNFSLDRNGNPRNTWQLLASEEWLEEDAFLYALEGAYLLFTIGRDNERTVLTVEDYAYTDASARSELLALLGSLHGQVELVRIQLPPDDPLTLDNHPRHIGSRRWPMQARIVDVGLAVAPLRSAAEFTLSLRVIDPLCSWNNGTFEVHSSPEGTVAEPATAAPDIELPVQTLPLLLFGILGSRNALAHGQASGDEEKLEALASLASRRPPFMPLSDAF